MKKRYFILLGMIVAPTLWAATPTPQDQLTALLTKIETNTANTATATGTTLSQEVQTMATDAKQTATTQQADAQKYLYATATGDQYTAGVQASLQATQAADVAATNAAVTLATQNDASLLCGSQGAFNNSPVCLNAAKQGLNPEDGLILFSQSVYANPQQASGYVNHLYSSAYQSSSLFDLPHLTMATGVLGILLEQRMPAGQGKPSFMSQLQTLITLPTTAGWQTAMNSASQSDRVRMQTSLTATQNYLSYLQLQATEQNSALLATVILQRAQSNQIQQSQLDALNKIAVLLAEEIKTQKK